jgi:hypothetical protein
LLGDHARDINCAPLLEHNDVALPIATGLRLIESRNEIADGADFIFRASNEQRTT